MFTYAYTYTPTYILFTHTHIHTLSFCLEYNDTLTQTLPISHAHTPVVSLPFFARPHTYKHSARTLGAPQNPNSRTRPRKDDGFQNSPQQYAAAAGVASALRWASGCVCVYVCMCVCVCVCVFVYVYVCVGGWVGLCVYECVCVIIFGNYDRWPQY